MTWSCGLVAVQVVLHQYSEYERTVIRQSTVMDDVGRIRS